MNQSIDDVDVEVGNIARYANGCPRCGRETEEEGSCCDDYKEDDVLDDAFNLFSVDGFLQKTDDVGGLKLPGAERGNANLSKGRGKTGEAMHQ